MGMLGIRSLRARSHGLRMVALAAWAAVALALAPAAAARPKDAGDMKHAVQIASPAVVRIVSEIQGKVVCRGCNLNDGSDISFPLKGGMYTVYDAGSGAFVSPDGYLLTADHVADPRKDPNVAQYFLNQAINELAQTASITTSTAQSDFQAEQNQGTLSVPIQVTRQQAFLSTSYTGKLQNTAQVTSYAITRIVTSSPVDQQDTAIVKVEAHDLPFLQLASASGVRVQDSVTAVAYPADADLGNFPFLFAPTQSDINTINGLLSPSVNTGQVTAQKTLPDGTLVYETNGIAGPGSSGGPVLDAQGHIVGFVDAGNATASIVYLIPSDVAGQYVKEAGVVNPSGAFMSLWTKAVNEYNATSACHFTNASKDFAALQSQYPNFGGLIDFADVKTKATPADCPPPSTGISPLTIGLAAGGALAALAIAGLLVLMMRRGKARQPVPVAAGPAGYMMSAPGTAAPGAPPSHATYAGGPQTPPIPQAPQTPRGYPTPTPSTGDGLSTALGPWQQGSTTPPSSYGPTQQPAMSPAPGGIYGAPTTPVAPYGDPALPPAEQAMQTGAGKTQPAATPMAAVQTPPAYSQAQPPLPAPRLCANGHVMPDASARFCPLCGAPGS